MKASPIVLYAGGALVVIGVVFVVSRNAKSIGKATGQAAVQTAGDLVGGLAVGIGKALGIPDTDSAKCRAALAAGNLGDSLVYCSASEFNAGWFTRGGGGAADPLSQEDADLGALMGWTERERQINDTSRAGLAEQGLTNPGGVVAP